MKKLPAILLFALAVFLTTLAIWSWRIATRIDESVILISTEVTADSLYIKGLICAASAVAFVILGIKAKPRQQEIVLGSLFSIILIAEIFFALADYTPFNDLPRRHTEPYIMFTGQPVEPLSELGYRDSIPMPKVDEEFRVIMLGGSTVYSVNTSNNDHTIAGRLEEMLIDAGHSNVRVYNWGVISGVSGQELATIVFRAADYAPDLILIYNGVNDLGLPYSHDARPGFPINAMVIDGAERILSGNFGLFDLYAILMRPSVVGFTIFQAEIVEQVTDRTRLDERVDWGSDAWRNEIVTQYSANLEKMCMLSRAFDFQVAAFLQPMLYFKDEIVGGENNWWDVLGAGYRDHIRAAYALAQPEIESLANQYPECLFHDATFLFKDVEEEIYTDAVHINTDGYIMVAEYLANELAPLLAE